MNVLNIENNKLIRVLNKTDLFAENVIHLHASAATVNGSTNTEIEFHV